MLKCVENEWDTTPGGREHRKAVALSAQEQGAWMPYIMLRYTGKVESFIEFIRLQVDPNTGEYKKGFLDSLLEKLGV